MKSRLYRPILICLCCAALLTISCVDLGEVTKFAAQSANAQSSLAALVADFRGTCERMNLFSPPGGRPQDCGKYDSLSSGTFAAQDVLLKYINALGTLSSDKTITFDKDLKGLPDKLKGSGLDDKQVTAATTLASKLADAAINGYRRKKVMRPSFRSPLFTQGMLPPKKLFCLRDGVPPELHWPSESNEVKAHPSGRSSPLVASSSRIVWAFVLMLSYPPSRARRPYHSHFRSAPASSQSHSAPQQPLPAPQSHPSPVPAVDKTGNGCLGSSLELPRRNAQPAKIRLH